MSSKVRFLLGCDPELFCHNGGTLVSAHNLVPGTKETPHKVTGGAIQRDGLALEFNTDPVPYEDFKGFEESILTVMKEAHKTLKTNGEAFGFKPGMTTAVFDKSYYEGLPESAKELGCDPDFCAYSVKPFEPNERPDGDSGMRSAAGHIHVGWGKDIPIDNEDHMEICRSFVKNLDAFVGLGMTILDRDPRRRALYGKAGAFRPKSYGVEYRTPSNAWIWSGANRRFIHRLISASITDMMKGPGNTAFDLMTKVGIDVQDVINSGNVKVAKNALRDLCSVSVDEARLNIFGPDGEIKVEVAAPTSAKAA